MKLVKPSHVIYWRDSMKERGKSPETIRVRLAALSSLFKYLCTNGTVDGNPVVGIKRDPTPNIGKTPPISDQQVLALLEAPDTGTLKGKRDKAIIATLYYHFHRRDSICRLKVKDIQQLAGIPHFMFHAKGGKVVPVLIKPVALRLIHEYLESSGHRDDPNAPLFKPVINNRTKILDKHLDGKTIWQIVKKYAKQTGLLNDVPGFTTHSSRVTSVTKARKNKQETEKIMKDAGMSSYSTFQRYARISFEPEDSTVNAVDYQK